MSQNITIDGREYPLELLSESAKGQLIYLQLVDKKIDETQQQLAILQTARNAYASELRNALPAEDIAL